MITSDEGHMFLNSIQVKQKNGEAKRAFLCKLWEGKEYFTTLSTGNRGSERTSMSLCVLIQSQMMLTELCHLQGAGDLFDRFLFIAAKPCMHKTNVAAEAHAELYTKRITVFVRVFEQICIDHKNGLTYTLAPDAETEYSTLVDCYADFLQRKYDSDSG